MPQDVPSTPRKRCLLCNRRLPNGCDVHLKYTGRMHEVPPDMCWGPGASDCWHNRMLLAERVLRQVEWRGPPVLYGRDGEPNRTCPSCGQVQGRAATALHRAGCELDAFLKGNPVPPTKPPEGAVVNTQHPHDIVPEHQIPKGKKAQYVPVLDSELAALTAMSIEERAEWLKAKGLPHIGKREQARAARQAAREGGSAT